MKNHSLLFFTIFICSLVAGYTFSTRFYPSDFSFLHSSLRLVTTQSQNPIPTMSNGQRSLLLISATSINSGDPQLKGIWLATYFPSGSNIRLLPIFPSGDQPISEFETQIVQSFGFNKKNGQLVLAHDFIAVLEKDNYWWSGYLVLDQVAMADIFDLLGGIEMKGQMLSGEQVITELPDPLDEPGNAYSYQIAMLQSVCKQFTQRTSNTDLTQVSSLLHRHILTDLQPEQLRTEFQILLASERQPACKFPLLEKSQIVQ